MTRDRSKTKVGDHAVSRHVAVRSNDHTGKIESRAKVVGLEIVGRERDTGHKKYRYT